MQVLSRIADTYERIEQLSYALEKSCILWRQILTTDLQQKSTESVKSSQGYVYVGYGLTLVF